MSVIEQERAQTVPEVAAPDPVLLRAAEIVRERGLRKHDYGNDGGQRCVLGAIREAGDFPTDANPAADKLYRSFGWEWDSHLIPSWNDDDERTADEAADALERAAYEM